MPKIIKDFDPHKPTCPQCKENLENPHAVITFDYLPDYQANVYHCPCGAVVIVVVPKDPTRN